MDEYQILGLKSYLALPPIPLTNFMSFPPSDTWQDRHAADSEPVCCASYVDCFDESFELYKS